MLEVGEAICFTNTSVIPGNRNGIMKLVIKHHTLELKTAQVPRDHTQSNSGSQISILLKWLLPDRTLQHLSALSCIQKNKPYCHQSVSNSRLLCGTGKMGCCYHRDRVVSAAASQ